MDGLATALLLNDATEVCVLSGIEARLQGLDPWSIGILCPIQSAISSAMISHVADAASAQDTEI